MRPPKPASRAERVSLWRYLKLFRADILSAQPERLFRARMAEFRTPFFRSFLVNETELVRLVLRERASEFPKSGRVGEGLRPLLGNAVFLTNGARWQAQRRIIDPAFEGGRLRHAFPAMVAAGQALVERLAARPGPVEVEEMASKVTADVIFRSLFSIPISEQTAAQVFREFRAFQASQPILNVGAFVALPRWFPRFHRRATRRTARRLRGLMYRLTMARMADIEAGRAPDDLATKIMTTPDPETGACFGVEEMVDQVAIFFLAGHETSAAALGWALFLLAQFPEAQMRAAAEAARLPETPELSDISALKFTRNVFREALRLYPPVPMLVREAARAQRFRGRAVPRGAQVVVSPWHLHRNPRYWSDPDGFDPDRFSRAREAAAVKDAYIPFSAGPRVCPGAGFAMAEGTVLLAMILKQFRLDLLERAPPVPRAHLTVRARDGIWLGIAPRTAAAHGDGA